MKILITGGNGFIARNLAEELSDYDLVISTRKDTDLYDSKATKKLLMKTRPYAVIHTANCDAEPEFSKWDVTDVLDQNLRMFFNLVKNDNLYSRLIYYGSGAEYSRTFWSRNMSEDQIGTCIPLDPYGFSKYVMNTYARKTNNIYNLRLFSVYGEYEDWRYRTTSNAIVKAQHGMPVTVKSARNADYLYVKDLCKITRRFIEPIRPKFQDYNVCSGSMYTPIEIGEKVLKLYGRATEKVSVIDDWPKREYSGDNSRLLAEFGCALPTFTSISQGAKNTKDWITKTTTNPEELLY